MKWLWPNPAVRFEPARQSNILAAGQGRLRPHIVPLADDLIVVSNPAQAQTRDVLEARLAAAKLRRAKRKAREAMDAGRGGGGSSGNGNGGGNSRASSAASVISSAHPSPAKQAGSGRCVHVQRQQPAASTLQKASGYRRRNSDLALGRRRLCRLSGGCWVSGLQTHHEDARDYHCIFADDGHDAVYRADRVTRRLCYMVSED